jgi:hypothetical protein
MRMLLPFFFPLFARQAPVTVFFPLPTAPVVTPQEDMTPPFQAPFADVDLDAPRPTAPPTTNAGFAISQRIGEVPAFLKIVFANPPSFERSAVTAILHWQPPKIVRLVRELRSAFEPAMLAELLLPEMAPTVASSINVLGSLVRESAFAAGELSEEIGQLADWQKLAAVGALAGLVEAAHMWRQRKDSRQTMALQIPGITGPAGLT